MIASRTFFLVAACFCAAFALPTKEETTANPTPVLDPQEFHDTFFGLGPFFSNLFAPLWTLFPGFSGNTPDLILRDGNALVTLKVSEYKKEDLNIKIKNNMVVVHGEHESKKDGNNLFAKSFYYTQPLLNENATASEAKAELSSDGWLIVKIPLNGNADRSGSEVVVPITETGAPYVPPAKEESEPPKKSESTVPAAVPDEHKEETTQKNIQDNEVEPVFN